MPDLLPKLPPLVALRAFHALGVTGSVRGAGEALGVSYTAISRHVRNLEEALGVKLVRPAGRGLAMTIAGAEFFAQINAPLGAIAEAAARTARRSRQLTIRCTPGFANMRVLPRLPDLQHVLPDREVVLEPRLSRNSLVAPEVDIEIVFLERPDIEPPLRGELLVRPRVFPVMSPDLLGPQPALPRTVEQLWQLPMLHDEAMDHWRVWLRAMGSPLQPHGSCLGTAQLALEAARLGQGVALSNALLAEQDVLAGRLIEPVPSDVYANGYYLLAEATRWDEPAIAIIRAWMRDICRLAPQPVP